MRRLAITRTAKGRSGERGLTLIEVLVSFFILFVVTLAVLQLLSMAYLVNNGAMIRTELMYKAQQVAETVRLQRYRVTFLHFADDPCCPITSGQSKEIIYSDATCLPFWSTDGANVIDAASRYALSYTIDATGSLTVSAIPGMGVNVNGETVSNYIGPAATKVVVYVAQLP